MDISSESECTPGLRVMGILMCPPLYYAIEYEINPWMNLSRDSNFPSAMAQWLALYQLLQQQLRIKVALIEPRPGLPDMVFTANAGLVWKNKFIVSNFRYQVRQAEATYFENWFAARDYEIFRVGNENPFEGEGDLLMCGELLFAGYPTRSSMLAHQKTAEIIEREIVSLRLTNDWFYHLDTCFCPLSSHEALYYPAAFDAIALRRLENHIGTLLPVTEEEARRFACNAIVVEKSVIMNEGCPRIRRLLESLGYSVFEIPLTEFIKAGGSAKCLVLKVPHWNN